jgi:hypothetical protein
MLLRLFVALNPPPEVRERLALAQTHLRMALGEALDSQVALRWTRPAQFHLTLLFLGNVLDDQLPVLTRAVQEAAAPVQSHGAREPPDSDSVASIPARIPAASHLAVTSSKLNTWGSPSGARYGRSVS